MFAPFTLRGKLKLFCRLSRSMLCILKLLNLWLNQELLSWLAFQLWGIFFLNQQTSTKTFCLEPLLDTMTDKWLGLFVLDNKNFEQHIKYGNKPQTQVCTELYKSTEESPGKPVKAGMLWEEQLRLHSREYWSCCLGFMGVWHPGFPIGAVVWT